MRAGQEGAITAPAEAAQSTKHTSDLLRRFKEYATSVKEGMKAEPPPLTEEETALRNEKIRVDDFQEKLIHASRKVRVHVPALHPLHGRASLQNGCDMAKPYVMGLIHIIWAYTAGESVGRCGYFSKT